MNTVEQILERVRTTLQVAKHGQEDLESGARERRPSSLRNVIVFGRSVTFVLQNLKTPLGNEVFNAWYEPHQERLKADPVMRHMVTIRNEIEKQGNLKLSTSAYIHSWGGDDMRKLGSPPAGAKGFFIGDQNGGNGWEIELGEGRTEKFYVELPLGKVEITQHFADVPAWALEAFDGKSVEELCRYYIDHLSAIVDDAFNKFSPSTVNGKVKRRGHLALVKK